MKNDNAHISGLMNERFGHDCVIALATYDGDPHVRMVNGYYEDGCFYVITHALSGKMKQIAICPKAAVAGEWFTGHGVGENLGSIKLTANRELWDKLYKVFGAWIDNGHTDLEDDNTVILRIRLTDGVLLSHGVRYEAEFPL